MDDINKHLEEEYKPGPLLTIILFLLYTFIIHGLAIAGVVFMMKSIASGEVM